MGIYLAYQLLSFIDYYKMIKLFVFEKLGKQTIIYPNKNISFPKLKAFITNWNIEWTYKNTYKEI